MRNSDSSSLGNIYLKMLTEQYYNRELNPKFWSGDAFDADVREKLLNIADDFYEHLNITAPIIDIQLTGSLANYNYNDQSDLDVHVIIDFSLINDDTELVKKALDGTRFIWNTRHNIVIKGHDVELYVQDVNEQHTASGLYSLQDGKWLKEPAFNPPSIDERDVEEKYRLYVDEIFRISELLDTRELTPEEYRDISRRADRIRSKIQRDRKEGLQKDGEFSVENLVFKKLRNNGEIENLIDIAAKAYDNIYSDQD